LIVSLFLLHNVAAYNGAVMLCSCAYNITLYRQHKSLVVLWNR